MRLIELIGVCVCVGLFLYGLFQFSGDLGKAYGKPEKEEHKEKETTNE